MVGSRKCKVCTVSGTNHISINDTFFDKVLRNVVDKLCDFELEERKIAAVFICQQCTRLLIQTEFVLERVRESFKNLGKNVKIPRVKSAVKKAPLNISQTTVGEQQGLNVTPKKDMSLPNLGETTSTGKQNAAKRKLELKANHVNSTDEVLSSEQNETGEKSKLAKKSRKLSTEAATPTAHSNAATPKSENTSAQQEANSKVKKRKSAPEVMDVNKTSTANKSEAIKAASENSSALANGSMVMPAEVSPTKERLSMDANANETLTYNSQDESLHKLKAVNCVICKSEFHSKTELYAHFDAQHSGEQMKQCHHCEMEFKSLQKYESHVRHEKCKNRKFQCPHSDCGRRFSTKQKLEIHDQSKHA